MRFVNLSLIGYFILMTGLGICLWQLGALRHIAPAWIWMTIAALVTAGLGIFITESSGKPTVG
jgi:hypothetical protein